MHATAPELFTPPVQIASKIFIRTQRTFNFFSLLALASTAIIAGCSSVPSAPQSSQSSQSSPPAASKPAPVNPIANANPNRQAPMPAAGSGRGGYYQDDGPGENPPENLLAIPDAEPKIEPIRPSTSRPYVVFGKTYTPLASNEPLKQRGIGSWYGKKFHGQKTASGERYDMYKMTAAHPTMPLPSYARVTNLSNGNQVIVRVNDRGPFHSSRIIDLSFTAAMKLGYVGKGSSELEVERLMPDEIARLEKSRLGERAVAVADNSKKIPANGSSASDVSTATFAPPVRLATTAALNDNTLPMPMPLSDPLAAFDTAGANIDMTSLASATSNVSPVSQGAFYLQLGAYSQALNAEAARARLAGETAQTLPPLEVAQTGAIFKVLSGPFQSRSDAAMAAQKLGEASGVKPFIVQR